MTVAIIESVWCHCEQLVVCPRTLFALLTQLLYGYAYP